MRESETAPASTADSATLLRHGAAVLPAVTLDAYNAELRDAEGFIGDRASKRAFRRILEDWRDRLLDAADHRLPDIAEAAALPKKKLDRLITDGDPQAAAVVHAAVEEFAGELAAVTRRFLRLRGWRDTERIVVGGGLRGSRVGELAIARAALLLKSAGQKVEMVPIRHLPDEAGLIGALHLAPSWIFAGHDSILAADIGGTNMRAGIVELNAGKAADYSHARVAAFRHWRHADQRPGREAAVDHLAALLRELLEIGAQQKLKLAPFIGIGCPGLINPDGSIRRGGQNLPGNWESRKFHLPGRLRSAIGQIGGHDTVVLMHNDAVVQGLSQVPFNRDVTRWGVLTMGTGLGNARFTNR